MRHDARYLLGACGANGMALLVVLCGYGVMSGAAQSAASGGAGAQATSAPSEPLKQAVSAQGQFYCNAKALSGEERARHTRLTEKLIAVRDAVVETPKGYEFQFRPENVAVAELAEWVVAESKCCPFFYFHIDLEKEGRLVCLGLTGPEGVKAFIRGEFAVKGGE